MTVLLPKFIILTRRQGDHVRLNVASIECYGHADNPAPDTVPEHKVNSYVRVIDSKVYYYVKETPKEIDSLLMKLGVEIIWKM